MKSSIVPSDHWLDETATDQTECGTRFILVMTILGAILRLYGLTGQSLWVDEILTWQALRPDLPFSFLEQVRDTIQGPLYLAVVWPLVRMGDGELMLRLPAAVAGILAIPMFGKLARDLVGGRAARIALLLFALNPFLIWYSQEGRGYAFLVLFSILTALGYRALANDDRRRSVVGFGLAGAAMVLSNLSGVFLLVAMAGSVLLVHHPRSRASRLAWLGGFVLIAILVAPWLMRASGIWAVDRIMPGSGTGSALRGATTFSPMGIPYAFFTFFFGYSLGPSLRELHQPDRMAVLMGYWPLLAAGGVGAAVAVAVGLFRPGRRQVMLLLWILVPVGLGVLLAVRNIKPWNARYISVALPWLILLAGMGLARLPRRPGAVFTICLVGLTLTALAGHFANPKYAKADIRSAVAWVHAESEAANVVLVPVVTGVFGFYDRNGNRLLDSYGRPPLADMEQMDAYLDEVLHDVDSCTVVMARDWYFDPEGFLLPGLALRGELVSAREFPGVELYTWQRRGVPAIDTDTRKNNGP